MSQGASNIDHTTHPLLSALSTWTPGQTSYTYAFADAGEAVYKSSYTGGDDFTRAWTDEEKDSFRTVVARFEELCGLTFTEVSSNASSDLNLQMVDNVPGGWAGYATYGGPHYVVGGDGLALLTHELGHSMWLSHSFDNGALPGVTETHDPGDNGFNAEYYTAMAYRTGEIAEYPDVDFANPDSLGVFDVATLQAMYGANSTTRTGNDTYGVTDKIVTIWDAGGNDAIDFSTSRTDGVIDLRAATLLEEAGGGGWASFADMNGTDVGAYMIAYGVVIENAYSGAGDDTVTGNAAANRLLAGLGDDTVTGGAGNDTIEGSDAGQEIETIDLIEMNTDAATDRALQADDFAMPNSVTIDMVVQLDAGTTHAQRLLSYEPDVRGDVVLELQVWDDSSPYLYAMIRTGSTSLSTLWTGIGKGEIADGELHRITMSRDAATGTYKFYLDGELQSTQTHRAGESLVSGGDLEFGQSQGLWGSEGNPDYAMKGEFGGIAIYDQALSDSDVAARTLYDLADTSDSRLVNFWRPDSDTGTVETLDGSADLTVTGDGTVTRYVLNGDDDLLNGESGDDFVDGNAGSDTLIGEAGDDTLNGGDGQDSLYGGSNADLLRGNDGSDTLDAGGGADFANGGKQHDLIYGKGGDDHLEGANGRDTIDGGSGADLIFGGGFNDEIYGGSDNDTIRGNTGKDELTGDRGDDSLMGGNQDDTLWGSEGLDTLLGLNGFDVLWGESGDDHLDGGNAGDTMDGGLGQDMLIGGDGKDSLLGGDGADTLNGSDGDDTLTGGADDDTFVFNNGWDADVITDFSSDDGEVIDFSAVSKILDFVDLIGNHIRDNGGEAEIYAGNNTILLQGVTVGQIGFGLDYSEADFLF